LNRAVDPALAQFSAECRDEDVQNGKPFNNFHVLQDVENYINVLGPSIRDVTIALSDLHRAYGGSGLKTDSSQAIHDFAELHADMQKAMVVLDKVSKGMALDKRDHATYEKIPALLENISVAISLRDNDVNTFTDNVGIHDKSIAMYLPSPMSDEYVSQAANLLNAVASKINQSLGRQTPRTP
jgi:hypothetical protein